MTEFPIGTREQIAWVEESTYKDLGANTLSSDGEIVGYNTVINPSLSRVWHEILNSGADTPELKSMVKGNKVLNFTLTFTPYNWTFLKYCTHPSVTNSDQGSYNEHTWTIDNAIKSFQLEWANRMATDHVITLIGCTIKDFKIKFSKGTGPTDGFVTVEANCVASDYSSDSSVTSMTPPTDDPLRFFDTKFTYNSSEVVEVNSGEIRCDNGINEDDSRYCNDTYADTLAEPIPTVKRYGITMNITHSDSTYFDDWDNGTTLSGTNKLRFYKDTHDWVEVSFTNPRLGVAPVPATNLTGPNKLDLVIVPTTLAITGEDANDY